MTTPQTYLDGVLKDQTRVLGYFHRLSSITQEMFIENTKSLRVLRELWMTASLSPKQRAMVRKRLEELPSDWSRPPAPLGTASC